MRKIIICTLLFHSVYAWPFSQSADICKRSVGVLHAHIKGKQLHNKEKHSPFDAQHLFL